MNANRNTKRSRNFHFQLFRTIPAQTTKTGYIFQLCAILLMFLVSVRPVAQELTLYQTTNLDLYSVFLQDSIYIDLHLPESHREAAGNVPFPVIMLFDSYNELTHAYNLHSIDILTLHGQIPESIIAGIPFTMQNRRHLTSQEVKAGDTISGIERMAHFIFNELLPLLKSEYEGSGPVLLFGHSRTAYLTSYLMCKRFEEFELAGSFSGFFEAGFEKNDIKNFLNTFSRASGRFNFYFSAGTALEEATYLEDYQELTQLLAGVTTPPNFSWRYIENNHANHMTNYNLSLPEVLVDYFAHYNTILDTWLFQKLETLAADSALITLQKDFDDASLFYGKTITPSPLHFFSIASYYANKRDHQIALDIYLHGKELYPNSWEMDYSIVGLYLLTGEKSLAEGWVEQTRTRILADDSISTSVKAEMIRSFDGMIGD
jgi:enterochelin esterase-like enzyme